MTGYRYDAGGRLTGVISPDPDGAGALRFAAVRNTYNAQGMLMAVEYGELSAWQSEAIAPANWSGFTVFQSEARAFDDWGRPTRASLISGGITHAVTQMSYDPYGRLDCMAIRMNTAAFSSTPANACVLGVEGAEGKDRITRSEYDALDRVTRIMRAYGTPSQQDYARYQYSGNGNRTVILDANGNRTEQMFDGFDRLSRITFPSATTAGQANVDDYEAYLYDPNNNRISLRKRDGQVVAYSYDALNRVSAVDVGGAATAEDVYYSYDLRNLRLTTRFASPTGLGLTETYDGFGRRNAATLNLGGASRQLAHVYDAEGNRVRITHPDGVYFIYEYDGLNRMTRVLENGAAELERVAYDPQGRRSALARSGGAGAPTLYSYDPISRLSQVTHDLIGTSADLSFSFAYNPANQVLSRSIATNNPAYAYAPATAESVPYVRNGLNQYTNVGGAAFAYDLNANLISDGTTTFSYDVGNRLRTAVGARSGILNYDPLGRLYETTSAGVTTRFLYDGDALVAEYDGAGALLRRYVHGPGVDEPWVWYEGAPVSNANRRFLHSDHQGSIVGISDSSATLIAADAYDPYGVGAANNLGRFQYTGQIALPGLQLYHYKARAYDARLGRFLQTDPVGYQDDYNLYAYVGNDPLSRIDPSGQYKEYVWTSRTDLTVVIPIAVVPGALPMNGTSQADIAARTAADFSGSYAYTDGSTINVTASVQFVPYDQALADAGLQNTLSVAPAGTRAQVDRIGGSEMRINEFSTSGVASHEFGHILGAQDQYTDVPSPGGGFTSQANPGWAGNLMGDSTAIYAPSSVPGSVDQRNFNEIFGVAPNQETCATTGDAGRCQ